MEDQDKEFVLNTGLHWWSVETGITSCEWLDDFGSEVVNRNEGPKYDKGVESRRLGLRITKARTKDFTEDSILVVL